VVVICLERVAHDIVYGLLDDAIPSSLVLLKSRQWFYFSGASLLSLSCKMGVAVMVILRLCQMAYVGMGLNTSNILSFS